MKTIFFTTIAIVLFTGCRDANQLVSHEEAKLKNPEVKDTGVSIQDAANLGKIEIIKERLNAGVDVNEKGIGGMTPLHRAAREGHNEAVRFLIANGADINAKDKRGRVPLHRVAREGHEEIAKILIASGAEVNAKSQLGSFKGETPLDEAIKRKQIGLASLLRENGGKYGSITVAAEVGDMKALKDFLSAGADLSGIGPLSAAASGGHKECLELLISNGAIVTAENRYGSTPLHHAATTDTANLLIINGADVNAKVNDGSSPLISAASKGYKGVCELLIENGAEVNQMSKTVTGEYKTALDLALDQSHEDIVNLLVKHQGVKAEGLISKD